MGYRGCSIWSIIDTTKEKHRNVENNYLINDDHSVKSPIVLFIGPPLETNSEYIHIVERIYKSLNFRNIVHIVKNN